MVPNSFTALANGFLFADGARHSLRPRSFRSCLVLRADTHCNSHDRREFYRVCQLLGVETDACLRENASGIRGMYLESSAARSGDSILSVPLSSCLRDDEPPEWLSKAICDVDDSSSQWATRLAACLLDAKLRSNDIGDEGRDRWLSMLPTNSWLRASLPIHWPPNVLSTAKCQALELAVDSAYFTRSYAVMDLTRGLKDELIETSHYSEEDLTLLANDALDVVQTRTCGVSVPSKDSPVRLLAPVFNFFNHGSKTFPGPGCPNAGFEVEEDCLVVRATKDIFESEEVLISYGDSAETTWRCLLNYGYLPGYDDEDERNTVELVVDGVRASIGAGSVPFELAVAAAKACAEEEGAVFNDDDNPLSAKAVYRIADRARAEAEDLLVDLKGIVESLETDEHVEKHSRRLVQGFRESQSEVLASWSSSLRAFGDTLE